MHQILQLTDLHLFADSSRRLRGVLPEQSFRDVLEHVVTHELDPAAVVLTGDLAHDELAETYDIVRQLIRELPDSVLVIPGNHDNRPALREAFPRQFELLGTRDLPPYVVFSRTLGDWQLIGLDTHIPGAVPGRLEPEQVQWLEQELNACADRSAVLFLHHPPIPVDSPWLDALGLLEPNGLHEVLEGRSNVRLMISGHVHQAFQGQLGHIAVRTAPATSMQFVPRQAEPAYDAIPPGYAVLTLENDSWDYRVTRLPELRFPPAADD